MNQSSPHILTIFAEALECPSEQQQAEYLDRACGSDTELRASVAGLLRAHQRAGRFLDGTASAARGSGDNGDEPVAAEKPGALIGPYKLLEQIGEGGFGVVFMAEQHHPVRRKVALKVIKPGMDTRQVIARFEAERQALALMDHPNIAHVLDAGETTNGHPYFVMDLIRGVPITSYCDQNNLTPRDRLELFVSVCQAVQHAHQKGIIHRDLKPSNVLVTLHDGNPVVKVIDFGIAKAVGQQLTEKTLFTNFAHMVGTPMYMSPEQAEMSGLDVDTRTDIYSLGVLLYELLTGTTPFDGDRLLKAGFDEVRRIIREEDPPRPSARISTLGQALDTLSAHRKTDPAQLGRLLRGELDWIVMKALGKDRRRRYETANAFAADVQHFLKNEPVNACPPSTLYRFRKFAARHKAPVAAGAITAIALLAGTAVSAWQAIRATRAEGVADERWQIAQTKSQLAIKAKHDAKRQLFEARLAQTRAGRATGQAGQRLESWKAVVRAAELARELGLEKERLLELRNEAIACLALADVQLIKEWDGGGADSSGAAFDADLELYARSDRHGTIFVRRVADDQEVCALALPADAGSDSRVAGMEFSADGRFLAVRYDPVKHVWIWDLPRRKPVFKSQFPIEGAAMRFSPDGSYIALGQSDGTITIHDAATGDDVGKPIKTGVQPMGLNYSPDGARLAVSSWWGKQVQVLDVASSAQLHKIPTTSGVWGAVWHPEGVLLAFGCEDRNLYLWDTKSGQPHAILRGHQAAPNVQGFAADGDIVVSWAWDGTTRLWNCWSGRELVRFAGITQAISRDSLRLASQRGRNLALWRIAPGHEFRTLPKRPRDAFGDYGKGGFSPDGRWLTLGTRMGARLWDLARAKEVEFPPIPPTMDVQFHPAKPELLTSGVAGLNHWPWRQGAGVFWIGPGQKLPAPQPLTYISLDREGVVLTTANDQGGWMLNSEKPSVSARLLRHANAQYVATSPNGRWLATGTFYGRGVKVWDADSGEHLQTLIPDDAGARVLFSPDNRWLVTPTNAEFYVWSTGSWQRFRQIPREQSVTNEGAAFSPDGRLLALTISLSGVRLLDPDNGAVFADLQAPEVGPISWMRFSPDGSQLALEAWTGDVRIWDLRRVRQHLREIGLDWDLPEYSPAHGADEPSPAPVERVEFAGFPAGLLPQPYLERAGRSAQRGQWADAAAGYSKALELDPANHLTWHDASALFLQTADIERYRNACREMISRFSEIDHPNVAERAAKTCCLAPGGLDNYEPAIRLAERAIADTESSGDYKWFVLSRGMADYRAGNLNDSIVWFEKSLSPGSELAVRDGLAYLFLAMAHHRLGHSDEVRQAMEKARTMQQRISPLDSGAIDNWPDCLRFHIVRREAEELLQVNEKSDQ